MKKIYRHVLHINPTSTVVDKLKFETLEYECSNFDSKTAKNFVIQFIENGIPEQDKRHLDRNVLNKLNVHHNHPNGLFLSIYFVDDAEGCKNLLFDTAEVEINKMVENLRALTKDLEAIDLSAVK